MSESSLPRPLKIADEVLARLETQGAIVPGARAEILRHVEHDHTAGESPVSRVFAILDSPAGSRYRKIGHEAPADPLERVLSALPLAGHGREALAQKLAMSANTVADVERAVEAMREAFATNNLPFDEAKVRREATATAAARVAELVLRELEDRDHRDYWRAAFRPEKPPGERRALEAIERVRHLFRTGFSADDREALAREWAGYLGGFPLHIGARKVAERLCMGHFGHLAPGGRAYDRNEIDWAWDSAFQPDSDPEETERARQQLYASGVYGPDL